MFIHNMAVEKWEPFKNFDLVFLTQIAFKIVNPLLISDIFPK